MSTIRWTHLRLTLEPDRGARTKFTIDGREVGKELIISVPHTEREEMGKALKYMIEQLGQGTIILAKPEEVFPEV